MNLFEKVMNGEMDTLPVPVDNETIVEGFVDDITVTKTDIRHVNVFKPELGLNLYLEYDMSDPQVARAFHLAIADGGNVIKPEPHLEFTVVGFEAEIIQEAANDDRLSMLEGFTQDEIQTVVRLLDEQRRKRLYQESGNVRDLDLIEFDVPDLHLSGGRTIWFPCKKLENREYSQQELCDLFFESFDVRRMVKVLKNVRYGKSEPIQEGWREEPHTAEDPREATADSKMLKWGHNGKYYNVPVVPQAVLDEVVEKRGPAQATISERRMDGWTYYGFGDESEELDWYAVGRGNLAFKGKVVDKGEVIQESNRQTRSEQNLKTIWFNINQRPPFKPAQIAMFNDIQNKLFRQNKVDEHRGQVTNPFTNVNYSLDLSDHAEVRIEQRDIVASAIKTWISDTTFVFKQTETKYAFASKYGCVVLDIVSQSENTLNCKVVTIWETYDSTSWNLLLREFLEYLYDPDGYILLGGGYYS
jgi:hypothetical protein